MQNGNTLDYRAGRHGTLPRDLPERDAHGHAREKVLQPVRSTDRSARMERLHRIGEGIQWSVVIGIAGWLAWTLLSSKFFS